MPEKPIRVFLSDLHWRRVNGGTLPRDERHVDLPAKIFALIRIHPRIIVHNAVLVIIMFVVIDDLLQEKFSVSRGGKLLYCRRTHRRSFPSLSTGSIVYTIEYCAAVPQPYKAAIFPSLQRSSILCFGSRGFVSTTCLIFS